MNVFFMSGGSSSEHSYRSLCLGPSPSGPFSAASIFKARPEKTLFTQGPVLEGFSVDVVQSTKCEIPPVALAGGR